MNNNSSTDFGKNEFEKLKLVIRSQVQNQRKDMQVDYARIFTYHTVKAYWNIIYPGKSLRLVNIERAFEELQLDDQLIGLATLMAQYPSKLDFVDASFQIGNLYTSLLPETYRASHGIFYTSPELAYRIIQMAEDAGIDWTTAKILDPACGGGAFLAPIAIKIATQLQTDDPETILTTIEKNLVGYEIDEFSAWLSQVFLEIALNKICKTKKRSIKSVVKICDTLEVLKSQEKFDLVIGNPPFGKLKLRENARKQYRESLYGHANMYGLFMHFGITQLNDNGILAFITPTSFLSGEYFKNLRSYVRHHCTPVQFDFVEYRKGMFQDVLQETVLSTYIKRAEEKQPVKINEIQYSDKIAIVPIGNFHLPAGNETPWFLPRNVEQASVINHFTNLPDRLADWGYAVKTGPLVWNRHKKQLTNKLGKGCYPLLWSESITPDGKFKWQAEKTNHTLFFKYNQSTDDWLLTSESCILLQRTSAKEQPRRLTSAVLPDSFLKKYGYVVIENHVNIIRTDTKSPSVSLKLLNVLLNSRAVDTIFRCISGSVAVSAYELEQLPLPPLRKLKTLERLVTHKCAVDLIEQECIKLFDLNNDTSPAVIAKRNLKKVATHFS